MDLESHVPALKETEHQTAYTGQFEKHWGQMGEWFTHHGGCSEDTGISDLSRNKESGRHHSLPCTPPHATGINKDHCRNQHKAHTWYLTCFPWAPPQTPDPRLWWIPLARHSGLRDAVVYLSPENQCKSHWCHGSQPMHCAGLGSHQQLWLQVLQKPEAHLVKCKLHPYALGPSA